MAPSITMMADTMNMVTGRLMAKRGTLMEILLLAVYARASLATASATRSGNRSPTTGTTAAAASAFTSRHVHRGDAVAVAQGERAGGDDARPLCQSFEDFDPIVVLKARGHGLELGGLSLDQEHSAFAFTVNDRVTRDGQRVGPPIHGEPDTREHAGLEAVAGIRHL